MSSTSTVLLCTLLLLGNVHLLSMSLSLNNIGRENKSYTIDKKKHNDGCISDHNPIKVTGAFSRRSLLSTTSFIYWCTMTTTSNALLSSISSANAAVLRSYDSSQFPFETKQDDDAPDIESMISRLIYKKILGQGGYKIVYLVEVPFFSSSSSSSPVTFSKDSPITKSKVEQQLHQGYQWALAVERIKSKQDAKNALRGIKIAEELETRRQDLFLKTTLKNSLTPVVVSPLMEEASQLQCFEQVEDWWFQSRPLAEFSPNQSVFFSTENSNAIRHIDRSQSLPSNYLGHTKWLLALKPVYEMDFRTLIKSTPTLYPILETRKSISRRCFASPHLVSSLDLMKQDVTALRLVREVCLAGYLMHSFGLVHRDIKPKNIMLNQQGHPVIIDFGFSFLVTKPNKSTGRYCVEDQPGTMKGEAGHMLSQDAACYQACQEGDLYAMGKTLYELLFGSSDGAKVSVSSSSSSSSESSMSISSSVSSSLSSSSSSSNMTMENIKKKESRFRALLADPSAGSKSRFCLSKDGRDCLLYIIRGLCRQENPLSFEEAVTYLDLQSADGINKIYPKILEKENEGTRTMY